MYRLSLPIATLLFTAGCGLDDLGVISVHIVLAPVLVELPDELSELDAGAFAAGSGTIHTDVPTGTGSVDAAELPELPDGFEYVPMLTFAANARAELPATEGSEAGHAHGVGEGGDDAEDTHEDDAADHADEEGGSVIGPALTFVGHDDWIGLFSTTDVDGFELGALRSGMVMIAAEEGPINEDVMMLPVMGGAVDFTGEGTAASDGGEEEEAGHAHGV